MIMPRRLSRLPDRSCSSFEHLVAGENDEPPDQTVRGLVGRDRGARYSSTSVTGCGSTRQVSTSSRT